MSYSNQPATIEWNHPSATNQTIRKRESEVKQYHWQAATVVWPTMTCGGGLHRTATCESAVMTAKTSTTSSTIGGMVGQDR
jgi:hypothetical protein